jgi:hypothetical protein
MVDRVGLLEVVVTQASFSAAQAVELNRQLDRALAIALAELSLQAARALPERQRSELESTLRDILTIADLRKVARTWEPERRIDSDESQTEVTDRLVELLNGRREPYVPFTSTLEQARALGDRQKADLRDSIARLAPAADLKRLAAKWDRNNRALTSAARSTLAAGLLALLAGRTEPLAG